MANHSWERRSWATKGALTPWEKVGAVVATGQLMRMGLEASGTLNQLEAHLYPSRDRRADPTSEDDANGTHTQFFTVVGPDARIVPIPEAISEFKRRLTNK